MSAAKDSVAGDVVVAAHDRLVATRTGIDTRGEPVVYLRNDAAIARSEGFAALARIRVCANGHAIDATLFTVSGPRCMLAPGQVGLSEAAFSALDVEEGAALTLSHAPAVESLGFLRAKVYGQRLDGQAFNAIIRDIVGGRYMGVHLAAFITACSGARLSPDEIVDLTGAMVDVGQRLQWPGKCIVDKHCVGGLPGNRTTPIVVAIVAAHGLTMPKTSSRAITSPAGSADTMETLAPVDLDLATMRRVVEREGACLAWGGSVSLSPADDILIRVERALDIDGEGQLVASVMSKKIAAGSTDILIDIPVGPTAKVRSRAAADALEAQFQYVAQAFGCRIQVLQTDGSQPIGRGVGPALEARDVLAVLKCSADAPADLRERAVLLAGTLLESVGAVAAGQGQVEASATLDDGRAWRKFQAICEAQGGMRVPPVARHRQDVFAPRSGVVRRIDNRLIARAAKLAGAPGDKAAGLFLHVKLGDRVREGDPLLTLHAESPGELAYALDYARTQGQAFEIGED